MKIRLVTKSIITILCLCLSVGFLQALLLPKYAEDVVEGNLVAEYYKEEDKSFDVLFVGDCEVYENFSPAAMWTNYGINSYIRGSAEQYIWQSYYLLEDSLRYYTPKVVVFNIQSLQFNESQSEAYNRMSIDGMKWSSSKIGAIQASMTEEEHFVEYLFPILRYHSRWSELTADDLTYLTTRKQVAYNGYFMRVDTLPAESVPPGRKLTDYSFGEKAWTYLDKMRMLCQEKGITLILIKAPSLYPYWYEEWDAQIVEYANQYGLDYYNFIDLAEEIGLDYSKDTYDAGLHLNLTGAEKLANYFGQILAEEYQVPDRRQEEHLNQIWEEKKQAYEAEIMRQCQQYDVNPSDLGR